MKGCFVCNKGGRLPYVYRNDRVEAISKEVDMLEEIINEENYIEHKDFLSEVEVIFCTWDMVEFTKEQILEYFPKLKVVFYAAASVRYFAKPFLELGIKVLTCHRIMAIPVAQFTVASIVMANKGALMTMRRYPKEGYGCNTLTQNIYPGTYKTKVGILGAGSIGSLVIKMLKDYNVEVMVYDPFLSEENQQKLGVTTSSLQEVFSQCHTISNHIANNEQTVGLLNYQLFSLMKNNGSFINTGRGAQVVEADLIRALKEEPLRTAILDVTYPEPVAPDSEFLQMENVFLFPHVAGYATDEVLMYPDFLLEQLERYKSGEDFDNCEVTLKMLETMA